MKVELRKCDNCEVQSDSFECSFERGHNTFDLCKSCVDKARNKITAEFGHGLSTCQALDYIWALFKTDMIKRAREEGV